MRSDTVITFYPTAVKPAYAVRQSVLDTVMQEPPLAVAGPIETATTRSRRLPVAG